ncbi:MAG: hypothetical protein A2X70_07250 [Alphaproteobacteria bacterium GWC2_42_16]|nr:MAG: hypothetical protein A2X70_07250 [Alphaproteobacteria bacterium GWC2_42_16]OFW74050.1 MAG: hypothetical protein A2Z80_07610 [Alphaproteobacteria bacterium GWA2_41_27]OFW83096.1 MAG: hypothetical protein A3E50_05700 [Alphaproteobacteria bacterium RIFCSPHIGHO2_12_FULL_42_100]OFW84596.1 MAG: hypothetical protein A2W06_07915 [Alphaproteobacteria bacterium RBG_16_42_14]OFW92013.1 MAG: hypothetical protein A3C41_06735 [Alphaproteobacteria bacterium RIFCSPHIGHO2_02_FULL_42_30]OFW93418.1 MAG: 
MRAYRYIVFILRHGERMRRCQESFERSGRNVTTQHTIPSYTSFSLRKKRRVKSWFFSMEASKAASSLCYLKLLKCIVQF